MDKLFDGKKCRCFRFRIMRRMFNACMIPVSFNYRDKRVIAKSFNYCPWCGRRLHFIKKNKPVVKDNGNSN